MEEAINLFGLIPRKDFPEDLAAKIKIEAEHFEEYLKNLGQNIR